MSVDVPAVILAGGRSRRMGVADKCLLPLGGRTILDHVLDAVRPHASAILINSNSDTDLFSRFGCPVRADTIPGHPGPLAGLLTGMRWAQALGASHLVTVPGDTPFLPSDLIEKLILAKAGHDIAIAAQGLDTHPTIGLWPTDLADRLEDDVIAGARKMRLWLNGFHVARAEWPMASEAFFNINREADLKEASDVVLRLPFRPATEWDFVRSPMLT
ncbi:MAG TPA: molybdenum cofactor guanylyltransferase MobA [Parvibaculum sp.]|jgi:molybdopterin-guanine dinucleotide biosynthesis protein A